MEINVQDMELKSLIGFDGNAVNGMIVHPDGVHLVYPLGTNVTAYNWNTRGQRFFVGHTNVISAVAVSRTGRYVCAGQVGRRYTTVHGGVVRGFVIFSSTYSFSSTGKFCSNVKFCVFLSFFFTFKRTFGRVLRGARTRPFFHVENTNGKTLTPYTASISYFLQPLIFRSET